MSLPALLALWVANLLTSVLSLSVLMLAFWQNLDDSIGRAVAQFLAALSIYNLASRLATSGAILPYSPSLEFGAINLSIDGFALTVITTFALVVTLARMMKQAYQVLAR